MPMMIMTDMVRKLSLQGVQGTRLAEQVLVRSLICGRPRSSGGLFLADRQAIFYE